MSNRRKFKRLPIRGFMKAEVGFSHGAKQYQDIPVLSLSAGGMFIAVDQQLSADFERGDMLSEIRLDLNGLPAMSPAGQIVHQMSLGEIGGCGVEFADLSEEQVTSIDSYVKKKLVEFGLWDFD